MLNNLATGIKQADKNQGLRTKLEVAEIKMDIDYFLGRKWPLKVIFSCLLALRDTKKYSTLNVKSIIIWKLCFESLKKAVASKSFSHYYQYAADLLKNLCHKRSRCASVQSCVNPHWSSRLTFVKASGKFPTQTSLYLKLDLLKPNCKIYNNGKYYLPLLN